MKRFYLFILVFVLFVQYTWAQKKLTEATVYYDVVVSTANNGSPRVADMLDGSTSITYIKGNLVRSDFISSLGSQSTVFNSRTGAASNIRDYGNKKFLITYSNAEWKLYNKKYENIKYTIEDDFKTIAGYRCQKAVGKLADGTMFTVYFTKDLIPIHHDFQYINRNLPGFAMQYDASRGKDKVTFTVSSIEFSVVPLSKFDVPQTGYRTMTYSDFVKGRVVRK